MVAARPWLAIVVPAVLALVALSACPGRDGQQDKVARPAEKPPASQESDRAGGQPGAPSPASAADQPAEVAAAPEKSGGAPPPPARAEARPQGRVLTLLHTSNLQGEYEAHPLGGLARRASYTFAARKAGEAVLQVDAGDTFLPALAPVPGDPLPAASEVARRAELVAAGLGRIGLDGFLPGETDLAMGLPALRKLVRKHRIPVVASNLLDAKGKPLFQAHKLLEVSGIRVGLVGVSTATDETRAALAEQGVTLDDAAGSAQGNVSLLREKGAEVVVALLHLAGGRAEAEQLLGQVVGIDVAVLGHEVLTLDPAVPIGPSPEGGPVLVSAGKWGKVLGRLDLHLVDGDPGFVAAASPAAGSWFDSQIVRLDARFVSDPGLVSLIRPYRQNNRRRAERRLPVNLTAQPGTDGKLATSTEEHWKYASGRACRLCHFQADDHFQGTAHALALLTLQNKARDRDPRCLACHTTGFERPGGTRNLETAVTYFANVGCESCHGPSGAHIRAQNKTGTRLEVPEEVCRECHTPEQSLTPFDYQSALREVIGPGHGEPLPEGAAAAQPAGQPM